MIRSAKWLYLRLVSPVFLWNVAALLGISCLFSAVLHVIAVSSSQLETPADSRKSRNCPKYVLFKSHHPINQEVVIGRIVLLGSSRDRFTYDYVKAALPFIDRSLNYQWKHPDIIQRETMQQRLNSPSGFSLAYGGNAIEVKSERIRDYLYWLGLADSSVSSSDSAIQSPGRFSMNLQFDTQSCLLSDLQAFDGSISKAILPIYPRKFVVELINSQVGNKP